MKTSFAELREVQQNMSRIIDAVIAPQLSYRMHKQAGKIKDAQKAMEKKRLELINKYGEKVEHKTSVPESKMKEFQDEYDKYMNAEFDLDMQLIPWECIEQSGIKLSAVDIAVLKNFIEIPIKLK